MVGSAAGAVGLVVPTKGRLCRKAVIPATLRGVLSKGHPVDTGRYSGEAGTTRTGSQYRTVLLAKFSRHSSIVAGNVPRASGTLVK